VSGELTGQVAIVTGGSRGIGHGIVRRLATDGAAVVVNYVAHRDEAEATVEIVRAAGGRAHAVRFDVGDAAAVEEAIDAIVDREGRVDILVNNAGLSVDGLVLRLREDDWQRVLRTNLGGALLCAKAVARVMIRRRYGRIINMTSVVAETGNAGQAAYCSAKAGVIGLSKALARELAPRQVTVNAVAPGLVDTEMTGGLTPEQRAAYIERIPLGRAATIEEVAAAVAFLASPAAGYITGHVLDVNGGLHM